MKKIVISKKYTKEEKVKKYKKTAGEAIKTIAIPPTYVSSNKKKEYNKKDKNYKSDY